VASIETHNLPFRAFIRKMGEMSNSLSSLALATSWLPRGRLLLLIGLGIMTWALLIVLFGGQAALRAIVAADARWLALAVLMHYSSFAVRGHRWQQLLGMMGRRLDYFYTTGLLLAGWFVSALLPARAGDFMRIGVLRLESPHHPPVPVAASLGSIVLERALDILAIVGLGLGFGWAVLRTQAPGWLVASYIAAIGLLMLLALGVALAPPVLGWLRRWSQHRLWQTLLTFGEQLAASLRVLFQQPRRGALVIVESLYIWLCDALVVWFVLRSLGAALPLDMAAFAALTVDVLAAAPLTPGGIGQIDAAYVALFALLPTTTFNVGAAVLLIRFISYWSFLFFSGVVTLLAGFGEVIQRVRTDADRLNPATSASPSSPDLPV
jgi:uncharacterized protein (TIRG00374 family)